MRWHINLLRYANWSLCALVRVAITVKSLIEQCKASKYISYVETNYLIVFSRLIYALITIVILRKLTSNYIYLFILQLLLVWAPLSFIPAHEKSFMLSIVSIAMKWQIRNIAIASKHTTMYDHSKPPSSSSFFCYCAYLHTRLRACIQYTRP